VLEDVIFLYDFDIVIYTTTIPKSSNIYISHTVPLHAEKSKNNMNLFSPNKGKKGENAIEEMTEEVLKYKFLATLKGHKNSSPPSIHYVEETGCLISGEKDEKELMIGNKAELAKSQEKFYKPSSHPTATLENLGEEKRYENFTIKAQHAPIKEILIWNLQKDLIHMMQANPPWLLRPTCRFDAHSGSIIDICYLPSMQLIATASTDQTIRFFDPTAASFSLSEPRQFPVVATKPGYYVPLDQEGTATNPTFKEVRRIYTAPMTAYKLQALSLVHNGSSKSDKVQTKAASIEWLVALKIAPGSSVSSQKQSQATISGYGIERIKLMVPAIRHDDPIPEAIHQECENEAQDRRKKAVVAFQSVLPYNLERLLANVALQTAQTNRLSELFKESMLNRATGKYMATKPLKEVFQILLEIPERKKYGQMIKEKGRANVLSVSEVYFYLKKYFQIHPTNLSQVMFAKLVRAFNEDQNKSLIGGIRKWPKEELNTLANYIRKYGLQSKDLLGFATANNEFLSRSQFVAFMKSIDLKLSDQQYENIANEVDPMGADRIAFQHLQHTFSDELKHYNMIMFRRPNPIIEEIRGKIIPHKKLKLHEALYNMDQYGDGYITKSEFVQAFSRAGIEIEKETLQYFFDMTSERFMPKDNEKVLSINTFIRKILTESESSEFSEMAKLLGKVAYSLTYRCIDFDVIFSEGIFSKLDYTAHVERHIDMLRIDEFVNRLEMLNITQLNSNEAKRIAMYLAGNDRKDGYAVIYFKNYMHHMMCLPSAEMSEPSPIHLLIAVICGKILAAEQRFIKQCQEVAELMNNFIEPAELRSVLLANGINTKTADLFVQNMTNNSSINLDEVLRKMKTEAIIKYKTRYELFQNVGETEIPFINFQEVLRAIFSDAKTDTNNLIKKCRTFDKLGNERIKLFHLLNIIKHNVKDIEEIVLAGLQYELTLIHPDEYVDYKEFLMQFKVIDIETPKSPILDQKKEKMRKEYNETLMKIHEITLKNKLDFEKVLNMFDSNNDGKITSEQLEKALTWAECKLETAEIENLITMSIRDEQTDDIKSFELVESVKFIDEISPYYNKQQWQAAARRANLPEQCKATIENLSQIEFLIRKQVPKGAVISKEIFVSAIKEANFGLSEEHILALVDYAIQGSKNSNKELQLAPIKEEFLNWNYFSQSIITAFDVKQGADWSESKFSLSPQSMRVAAKHKEQELMHKISIYFTKIGISFFEFFNEMNPHDEKLTKKHILDAIEVLHVPLSLQEQRLLLQVAGLDNAKEIDIETFCKQFDTPELLEKRRTKSMIKLETQIYIKGLPIENACDIMGANKKPEEIKINKSNIENLFLKEWGINLSKFEFDSILNVFNQNPQPKSENENIITKEELNSKLISQLIGLKDSVVRKIVENILNQLDRKLKIESAKSKISLLDLLEKYDFKKNGTVLNDTLNKIMSDLSLPKLSSTELQLLLNVGGADQLKPAFEYKIFCNTIESIMRTLHTRNTELFKLITDLLFTTIKQRKNSLFDAFCQFDVLKREGISKIEFICGFIGMNIEANYEDLETIWQLAQIENKITYHGFLAMFAECGFIKTSFMNEQSIATIRGEFMSQLSKAKLDVKTIFENQANMTRSDFFSKCKTAGISISEDLLSQVYESAEDKLSKTINARTLQDFTKTQENDEQSLISIFKRIHLKAVDWEKTFRQEITNKKQVDLSLSKIALSNCLRKVQIGLQISEIEAIIENLSYSKNGTINNEEFAKQVEAWTMKGMQKPTQNRRLKVYLAKMINGLKSKDISLETAFSEVDKNKDGLISVSEHHEIILKLGIDLTKSFATEIFMQIADKPNNMLSLQAIKTLIVNSGSDLANYNPDTYISPREEIKTSSSIDDRSQIYDQIKSQLLEKQTNIHSLFLKLKIDPTTTVPENGIAKLLDSIELTFTTKQLNLLYSDIKEAFGKDEFTYQDLLDFIIRKRIDPGYSGIEPGISICLNAILKVLKRNSITFAKAYAMFSKNKGAYITKNDFMLAVEGMQLGLSYDDIIAFFNYMNKTKSGEVTKQEFINVWALDMSATEKIASNGNGNNTLAAKNAKVGEALRKLGDTFEKFGYTLRQVAALFDIHGTGVITKSELTSLLRQRNIEISLDDVRILTGYLANIGEGRIYASDLMGKLQEILNQSTDGLYSIQQAKPIIKKIMKEIEGDLAALSEEILKFDKIIEYDDIKGDAAAILVNKSAIEKHNFYKLLTKFGVVLSEDEKGVLNSAFGYTALPNMLDTHKLMNMLESLPTAETSKKQQYTLEWERKIYRKLGNFLKSHVLTIQESLGKNAGPGGLIAVDEFGKNLRELNIGLNEKEIAMLLQVAKGTAEGKINIKKFAKQFYETYLLDAETATAEKMTKEDETALILRVIRKMKEKPGYNHAKAFAELDKKQVGFLTVTGLQFGLPEIFDIHLTREQLLVVLRYMDNNDDGMVTISEFTKFYNDYEQMLAENAKNKDHNVSKNSTEISLEEIFDSLLVTLKEKNLSLFEIFEQLDQRKHGYITLDEFLDLLHTIGFILPEQKIVQLLQTNDPNFSGKLSYRLLFKLSRSAAERKGIDFSEFGDEEIFKWRDRAVENVIKILNTTKKTHKEYFSTFDGNSDGILTPKEFRDSFKNLRTLGANIGRGQMDRLLLLFAVKQQQQGTGISIEKIADFLIQYSSSPFYAPSQPGNEEILVNEDMFVMIVQHFDGFSVLLNRTGEVSEKAQYVQSHKSEFITRGCSLLANSLMLERLKNGANLLAMNLKDTLVNLVSHGLRLIRSATSSMLIDPNTMNKPAQQKSFSESELELIKKYPVPEIDPKVIQLDKKFRPIQKNGCTICKGVLIDTNTPVRIVVYNSQLLNKQSADGKMYIRHLELELAAQQMLHTVNPELTFGIIGKYEKRQGIGEYSVDICVVLEDIPDLEYINFASLISTNGGLLQMPLLKNTETSIYIAKQWSRDILTILNILHSNGLVMRMLGPEHLYLHRSSSRIRIGNFFGLGKVDAEGKINMCPDINIDSQMHSNVFDNPSLAPEHLFRPFSDHTKDLDTWSFGTILFQILMGEAPASYFKEYKEWLKTHAHNLNDTLIEPSSISFIYDPLSGIQVNQKTGRISVSPQFPENSKFTPKSILSEGRLKCENTLKALQNLSYSSILDGKELAASGKLGVILNNDAKLRPKSNRETTAQLIEAMTSSKSGEKSLLGIILDLIACCLDMNPQNRPSLEDLLKSPIFGLDGYEKANSQLFAEAVFLYRDPYICITKQITQPLRRLCCIALKLNGKKILSLETDILEIIHKLAEYIHAFSVPNIRATQESLEEPKKSMAPHVNLAQRIISDHVVEMIIFFCHRYSKQFQENLNTPKEPETKPILKKGQEKPIPQTSKQDRATSTSAIKRAGTAKGLDDILGGDEEFDNHSRTKKVRFIDDSKVNESDTNKENRTDPSVDIRKRALTMKFKSDNTILSATCGLLFELVKEMQYRESVMSPHVGKILEYIVKLLIGEDFVFASDLVNMQNENSQKQNLHLKTFLRNKADFNEQFVPDELDKTWYLSHYNTHIINYETFWNYQSYLVVLPLYQGIFIYSKIYRMYWSYRTWICKISNNF